MRTNQYMYNSFESTRHFLYSEEQRKELLMSVRRYKYLSKVDRENLIASIKNTPLKKWSLDD